MSAAYSDPGSSDEGDGPESISLSQSRKDAETMDKKFKQILTAEKQKIRLRNKERDQRLKEQAERSKKRRKIHESEGTSGSAMLEAMQEGGDEADDERMGSEERTLSTDSNANPKHLPDHLFTSAFSKPTTNISKHRFAKDESRKTRKRTRSSLSSSKDLLIGSRVIRKLNPGVTHPGAFTIPSRKIQRFVDRSLALKGVTAKKQGWERRPVNIGVMKRNGPAAHFVRK